MSRNTRREQTSIGACALLLIVGVFISGCDTDESTATITTHTPQVTSTEALADLDEHSHEEPSGSKAQAASSRFDTIRSRLIRLLSINSLVTTHVAIPIR
jgi:hypothetical protein